MMKLHKTYPIWISITVLALAILACIGPTPVVPVDTQVPPPPPTSVVQNPTPGSQNPTPGPQNPSNVDQQPAASKADLIMATVQIYMLYNVNGKLTPKFSGSGTLLNSTGMILTNAHMASPAAQGNPEEEPDALAIGIMVKEDQPPVFSYYAKVKAVDGFLDLAVIQITSTLDGTNVDPNSLHLPFVKLGNSDDIHVGDPINVLGFPGIGGDTITFTTGSVSGFTPEGDLGDRAWIKTDAAISGGNSGGLGASTAGLIIGIPTKTGKGTGNDFVDCRRLADTNGDGVIDDKDTCIPVGEFLNALRPINLALPLITAVQTGQTYVSPYTIPGTAPTTPVATPNPQQPTSGNESFSGVNWFTVDSACNQGNSVSAYPTGTTALAPAWSFSGMTDGESWSIEYKYNGTSLFSKQYSWSLGPQGKVFHCLTGTFPDGNYSVLLSAGANNTLLAQADVVVGGGGPNPPSGPSGQGTVTVSGQVVDAASGNPIPGAGIYVLNPGITFDQWKTDQGADADIFTFTSADDQGNFSLPNKLALNVGYTFVFGAKGYKTQYGDNQILDSTTPTNLVLNIKLNK